MKRSLGSLLTGLAFALAGAHVSMPAAAQNVGDIFVPEDTDSFDPGLPIGARFPPIRALYRGAQITDVTRFMGEKGAVFFANRSTDW
jgi:hypothetical protein